MNEMVEIEGSIPQVVVDDAQQDDYGTPETSASEETVERPEEAATPPAENAPDNGAKARDGQREIDRAIGARLAKERSKYESSEAYRLGEMLLNERAKRDNVSRAEAFKRIQDERDKETAETYAKDPTRFYQDYLKDKRTPQAAPNDTGSEARRIGDELLEMQSNGELPEGFDMSKIDRSFYNDMATNGVKAAVDAWKVNAEMERRKNGPKPMRPTGSNPKAAPYDFTKMSDEEFLKLKEKVKAARLSGKTVRFS
jgi:hypothetical protein